MISEAKAFWDSISGKVKSLIRKETENAMRLQRYDVTTAPNGTVMGVRQPFGNNEIFLPYSQEVASATVGDTVLVAWWGSMSNAKVYYFADGYEGGGGGSGDVVASIVFPAAASWTDSGSGYWTATPTIAGVTLSAESKIDLQISAAQFLTLQNDGVENLYVENNNAALTAYAVGDRPTNSITLQCTISGTTPPSPPVNPSLDMIYPIGSIYMSVNSVNPANVIGGTWERIQDTFLLAAGTNHAAGSTGGEENHVLTVNEMPSHAGHVVESVRGGNINAYLDKAKMTTYGSSGRGWNVVAGNEMLPYGETLGGGQAHNNMPPYLAVFIWKRTA